MYFLWSNWQSVELSFWTIFHIHLLIRRRLIILVSTSDIIFVRSAITPIYLVISELTCQVLVRRLLSCINLIESMSLYMPSFNRSSPIVYIGMLLKHYLLRISLYPEDSNLLFQMHNLFVNLLINPSLGNVHAFV